jgi:hypothetical protein
MTANKFSVAVGSTRKLRIFVEDLCRATRQLARLGAFFNRLFAVPLVGCVEFAPFPFRNARKEKMSNFVKCKCQHCNQSIEFDADQLNGFPTSSVPCPYCNLETILFVPPEPPKPQIKRPRQFGMMSFFSGLRMVGMVQLFAAGKFEKFVFTVVRFFTVFWASLIVLGFLTTTIGYISTFLPSKDNLDTPSSILTDAVESEWMKNLGFYLGSLFVLFCALTMISFVLLLLAIERNTRKDYEEK